MGAIGNDRSLPSRARHSEAAFGPRLYYLGLLHIDIEIELIFGEVRSNTQRVLHMIFRILTKIHAGLGINC
jgi:hypothetical protein